MCVRVCVRFCIHDDLFARSLQHHVFGPVIPVLVGLGLVYNLLEHGPLPAQRQTFQSAHRNHSAVTVVIPKPGESELSHSVVPC